MTVRSFIFMFACLIAILLAVNWGDKSETLIEVVPAAFTKCPTPLPNSNPCGHHDCNRDRTRNLA